MGIPNATVQSVVLALLICHCHHALGFGDFLHLPNAEDIVRTVCPSDQICGVPDPENGIRTSCCRGCDCEDGCFLNNIKSEDETCMFPRSRFTNTYVQSISPTLTSAYYIVTRNPPEGCVDGNGDGCVVSGSSPISPVYSEERVKIYINSACAACHGVHEFVEWESGLVCDGLGSSTPMDFEREVTKYLRNPSMSSCFLTHFILGNDGVISRYCTAPGVESLLRRHKKDGGKDFIDPRFNLSIDGILDACKSNLNIPVTTTQKWYPNPFCFIYDEMEIHSPICYTRADNIMGLEYMTLLNPSVKAILQTNGEQASTNVVMACMDDFSHSEKLERQLCREVSCPFGHVRDREGNCIFFGQTIYFKSKTSFTVYVLLRRSGTDDPGDNDTPPLHTLTLDVVTKALQLPGWVISLFGISTNPENNETNQRDELLIRLQPVTRHSVEAFESIKQHLTKPIMLGDGYTNRTYTQEIYPLALPTSLSPNVHCALESYAVLQTNTPILNINKRSSPFGLNLTEPGKSQALDTKRKIIVVGSKDNGPGDFSVQSNRTTHLVDDDQGNSTTLRTDEVDTGNDIDTNGARYLSTCWRILFSDFRINTASFDVTKLYLCDMMELLPGEFRLMANDSVLYYELRQVYLYAKEFIVVENESGNKTARICIEDSGFVQKATSGVNGNGGVVAMFVVMLCQWILLR